MTDTRDRPSLRVLLTDRLGWLGLRSAQILLVVILASVIVFALVQLKLVVIPVVIALILAAAISPVVNWLRRRKVPSMAATWIVLLAGIGVFGSVITFVVFAVQSQWDELATAALDGVDQLQSFLLHGPFTIEPSQIDQARQALIDFVTSSQFGSGALAGVSVVAEVITSSVIGFVILFFFLKDGGKIWAFFLKPFRGARLARGRRIGFTAMRVLGGYARGTAIIALVDATGIGVGLFVLQVPLALPLAVFTFLTAFIPIVGATLAGVVAALVALVTNGSVVALIVVLIIIAVNQLESNLLQPVVMSQSVSLHPLVILIALTAGTILGGIIGAVIAVPIAAVAWAIAKAWNEPDVAVNTDIESGEDDAVASVED